ncbi:Smr/MutS family protein [Hellea balneolensis]|uniref:Smr/MutS family protein n=1 Tax=Hellea balneolensis TaxID=287478 RepID=UPI00041DFDB1|nr:Smr/MutS family protein [Hellea balneolensis]
MTRKSKTGRPLKPEEKTVWTRVAKTVAPRRYEKGPKSARPLPPTDPTTEDFAHMLRLPPDIAPTPRGLPQSLEPNQDKKTRRGQVTIDSKIDLHDMTQAQAKPALMKAIIRASNRNHKCVLVVTGKGLRGEGVLRRNFISWIGDPQIRPLIATYAQAHIKHGGSGAWYVFLKG